MINHFFNLKKRNNLIRNVIGNFITYLNLYNTLFNNIYYIPRDHNITRTSSAYVFRSFPLYIL